MPTPFAPKPSCKTRDSIPWHVLIDVDSSGKPLAPEESSKPAMTFGKYDEELKSQLKTLQFDDEVKDHVQLGTEGCVCEREFEKNFKRVIIISRSTGRVLKNIPLNLFLSIYNGFFF